MFSFPSKVATVAKRPNFIVIGNRWQPIRPEEVIDLYRRRKTVPETGASSPVWELFAAMIRKSAFCRSGQANPDGQRCLVPWSSAETNN